MKQWMQSEKLKNTLPYMLSFLIPFFVMSGVCINHGIYPFGENCFLHIDMYHQYAPFFMEFLNKLQNHGSLLYSWNLGIGSDFISTYAYYLASPTNWLLLLCPKGYLIEFMTILVLLKVSFSGLFFAIYLGKHFKTNSLLIPLVAMFYALSAYFTAYNWNIMWLDGVMLAPLIILGVERLVYEKKSYFYCAMLAIAIWSNYYIALLICVFLVLYFLVLQIELKNAIIFFYDKNTQRSLWRKEVLKFRFFSGIRFALYSLLAAAMSGVLLIPEMKILAYSGSSGIDFPTIGQWYFSVLGELARQMVGVSVYTGVDHWPNLYCGTAVLLVFVLYLLNRKISLKSKILRILLLGFFLLSFAQNQLDFLWHGLHFPDSLPARQSFLYIFVLLTLCFETLLKYKGNRAIHIGIALLAAMVFLLCCAIYTDKTLVTMDSFVMTAFLLGAYALVLVLLKSKNQTVKQVMVLFAFFLTITEATTNLSMTGIMVTSRTLYLKNLNAYETLVKKEKKEDKSFFRTEKFERMTKNESALSDYASALLFSSLMNINVANAYRKVGMEGGKNFYCFNGATPLTSAMLSVKYMLTTSSNEESPLRTLVAKKDGVYLYKNNYTLPLGFMVDSNINKFWNFENGSGVSMINDLGIQLGATGNILEPIATDGYNQDSTSIDVTQDSYLYATYANSSADTITETKGENIRTFVKCTHSYILDLGWCKAGTTVKLHSAEAPNLMVQAYKVNMDAFSKAYDTLNQSTMDLTSYSDTKVQGVIQVKKAGDFVLTIPNESGWTLYVDGKKVTKQTFMDGYIKVPLLKGKHHIKLIYFTPGLKEGLIISSIALFVFVLLISFHRKYQKENLTRLSVNEQTKDLLTKDTADETSKQVQINKKESEEEQDIYEAMEDENLEIDHYIKGMIQEDEHEKLEKEQEELKKKNDSHNER